jgi:hypothetical protein
VTAPIPQRREGDADVLTATSDGHPQPRGRLAFERDHEETLVILERR